MSTPTTVVRIAGPDALLSAIPVVLGFHPADSLVMACLTGDAHRLGPVCRMDLAAVAADTDRAAAALHNAALRYADDAVLVVYGDNPPRAAVMAVAADIASATGARPQVIHTGNTPHPVDTRLAAENAALGHALLQSRDDIDHSVAHHPGAECTAEQADIMAAMSTDTGRDRYLAAAIDNRASLPALIATAQATPDGYPHAADLLAVLAAVAYRMGDGTLANAALARAHACEPDHRLTLVLGLAVKAGIHPDTLAALADILH